MKIQCQKSQLVEAVSNVQRAVSSKIHTGRLGGDSLENHHERRFKALRL